MLSMERRIVPVGRRYRTRRCRTSSCMLVWAAMILIVGVILWHSHHVVSNPDVRRPRNAVDNKTRYVTLCAGRLIGQHKTGNHLFMLAAMLYVSVKTGRVIAMPDSGWILDATFHLNSVERLSAAPCPCTVVNPPNLYNADPRFDAGELLMTTDRALALCGLYQTYRYADSVSHDLRQLLQFRSEIVQEAQLFMNDSQPEEWRNESFVRVGVHIRRGDYLKGHDVGMTVIDENYLQHAMEYFVVQFNRLQFLVATDDREWAAQTLQHWSRNASGTVSRLAGGQEVVVTLAPRHSAGVDLAVLTACDVLILSTGSFGWWAAWLANKPAVYYRRWPREGSLLELQVDRYAYFPDRWIPMV